MRSTVLNGRMALLAWLAFATCAAGATVTGRVWIDRNANGKCDVGEPPAIGALMSDGRTIVATDGDGRYRLELAQTPATIFVVNPTGTRSSGHWWHAANGDATFDFALVEQDQKGPLYFVQGTDMHVRPTAVDLYRRYIEHVNRLPVPVQFVVHTGDLVVDSLAIDPTAASALFELYQRESSAIRFERRDLPGNHEHVAAARRELAGEGPDADKGLYRRLFGPTSYAFRYGPYHFVALDGTTIDRQAKNGYRDLLDAQSAEWAVEYLRHVAPDEYIVLLVHQPLAERGTTEPLLAALRDKHLLLTLCGHGHGRSTTTWGGAPMIMGGAVSYAWHGVSPFPPDPWGYVLYRLDGPKAEHVYLDWAVPRSFDLSAPAFKSVVASRSVTIEGTADDLTHTLRCIRCRLADQAVEATLTPPAPDALARRFTAVLDASNVADGVYDLTLEATDDEMSFKQARPIILRPGRSTPLPDAKAARIRVKTGRREHAGSEVHLNGQLLATLPAMPAAGETVLDVPGDRLQRLNMVTVAPGPNPTLEVQWLYLECGGELTCDVRFAPTMRRSIAKGGDGKTGIDYYLDPTYRGPRGVPSVPQ